MFNKTKLVFSEKKHQKTLFLCLQRARRRKAVVLNRGAAAPMSSQKSSRSATKF